MKQNRPLTSGRQLADFCGQMALVLKAGFSLEEALVLLTEDAPGLEPLLQQVRTSGDLAQALGSVSRPPEYFLQMVRLGQETGRLDQVMAALERHYRRELELRRSLRDALCYPGLMLVMVLVILTVLLGWVMPLFRQAYAQLGVGMTGLPLVLLELGQLLRRGGWLVPVVLAAGALLVLRRNGNAGKLLKKLPFFRGILRDIALSRVTGALALGLSSGLSTHYALSLARELNRDPALEEKLELCRLQLEQGGDLAQALLHTGILPAAGARLVRVGRRTGDLDSALGRVSADCRDRADRAIDRVIGSVEPVMVGLLSLLVGILLLSVLLPMLTLLSGL